MEKEKQNKVLEQLIASLDEGFDATERAIILDKLKDYTPTDDALIGAKMLLEDNDWDYTVLKKAFTKAEQRIKTDKPKSSTLPFYYLKYAAVLLPIGFLLGYFATNYFEHNAIDTYYVKEKGLSNLMGEETTNWDSLMKLYKGNEMERAFQYSEKLLLQKPENDTALYFHGVIAYELKYYEIADKEFAKISTQDTSVFYHDAAFRMGFVKYHLGQEKEAAAQFKQVSEDKNNTFHSSAAKVLTCLD